MEIGRLQNPRILQLADFLESFGLVNLLSHFRHRVRLCHMNTCWQVQQSRFLHSRCNYVLGSNLRLFETVGIRYLRNFLSGHFALRKRLLQRPTRCHGVYLRGLRAFPLTLPPMGPLNLLNTNLQELQAQEMPPHHVIAHPEPSGCQRIIYS